MDKLSAHFPAGDWPEDFEYENGNYMNRCHYCEHIFFGHKRRVVCKVCAEKPPQAGGLPPMTDQDVKLPEPTSEHYYWVGDPPRREYYFTAEQVRAAILAERDRCAKVCEGLMSVGAEAEECAAAIRKVE